MLFQDLPPNLLKSHGRKVNQRTHLFTDHNYPRYLSRCRSEFLRSGSIFKQTGAVSLRVVTCGTFTKQPRGESLGLTSRLKYIASRVEGETRGVSLVLGYVIFRTSEGLTGVVIELRCSQVFRCFLSCFAGELRPGGSYLGACLVL